MVEKYQIGDIETELMIARLLPNNTEFAKKMLCKHSENNRYNNFNISNGVSYAVMYAYFGNLNNYYYYIGGDCANFCSQILEAGGFPQSYTGYFNSGWWHLTNGTHAASYTWRYADDFCDYFGVDYSMHNHSSFSSTIAVGDFISRDETGDGDWDHVGFVSQKDASYNSSLGYTDYTVCQHTTDYCLKTSSSGNGWENIGTSGLYGIIRVNS